MHNAAKRKYDRSAAVHIEAGPSKIPSTDMSARDLPRFNDHRARVTTGATACSAPVFSRSRWGRFFAIWSHAAKGVQQVGEGSGKAASVGGLRWSGQPVCGLIH
jgi:hypothetical protein